MADAEILLQHPDGRRSRWLVAICSIDNEQTITEHIKKYFPLCEVLSIEIIKKE